MSRVAKLAVLILIFVFGQWVALSHACALPTHHAAIASSHSASSEHAPADDDELLCLATAVAGDEVADAVLSPLASDLSGAEHAPALRPPALPPLGRHSASRAFLSSDPRALLTLFGRLRI